VAFTFVATSVVPPGYANVAELPVFSVSNTFDPSWIRTGYRHTSHGLILQLRPSFISSPRTGNYQAEKNIEKLLGYIEKNSSVKLMLLEGAANKLQPELSAFFRNIRISTARSRTSSCRKAISRALNSFLIESSKNSEGFGIEDLDAYKKGPWCFHFCRKSDKPHRLFFWNYVLRPINNLPRSSIKDLLNLVRQEEAFGSGTVSFEAWLKVLGEASKKHLKMDLSDAFYQDQYLSLSVFTRLQAIGSKIDRERHIPKLFFFLQNSKSIRSQTTSSQVLKPFSTHPNLGF